MDKLQVKIKRFDKEVALPLSKTDGAAAFDFYARENVEIPPKEYKYVPLNVSVATPPDCFLLLVARSSTHKKGLMMANGAGIIDPDYSGNDDEISAVYYNFTDKPVLVEKNERIAQGLIVRREAIQWEEVETMPNKTRGGWGTTGNK